MTSPRQHGTDRRLRGLTCGCDRGWRLLASASPGPAAGRTCAALGCPECTPAGAVGNASVWSCTEASSSRAMVGCRRFSERRPGDGGGPSRDLSCKRRGAFSHSQLPRASAGLREAPVLGYSGSIPTPYCALLREAAHTAAQGMAPAVGAAAVTTTQAPRPAGPTTGPLRCATALLPRPCPAMSASQAP